MLIEACLPTLNRFDSAQRLIRSIGGQCPVRVSWEDTPHALTGVVNRLYKQSYKRGAEIILMLADHLEMRHGCIDAIREIFERHFPDMDGVVGLNMENLSPLPGVREYCFTAVGRRFLERFPDCNAFCPDYYHFYGDTEFGEYASLENRFIFAKGALVYSHLHTSFSNALKDETHQASRRFVAYDEWCRKERQSRGLLWGSSFSRISDCDAETAAARWVKNK